MLPVDTALISRLDATVCAYTLGQMQVAARERGDTGAVRCVEWENVRALYAPGMPNRAFNTVTISGPARLADIEGALDGYSDADAATRIQVVPGALSAELAALLSDRGFRQTGLQPVFVARAAELSPEPGTSIRVARVETPAALEAFQSLYARGWQLDAGVTALVTSFIPHWLGLPGWTLYLALEQGEPIGVATLFEQGEVCYLADAATPPSLRGRGAQSALVVARLEHAQQRGAALAFGMADFGCSSHRNLERGGVPMRYARALWTR